MSFTLKIINEYARSIQDSDATCPLIRRSEREVSGDTYGSAISKVRVLRSMNIFDAGIEKISGYSELILDYPINNQGRECECQYTLWIISFYEWMLVL